MFLKINEIYLIQSVEITKRKYLAILLEKKPCFNRILLKNWFHESSLKLKK